MEIFVEQECEMRLVVAPDYSIGVATRLWYSPHDPYAVYVDFHTGSDTRTTWVFARDLLAQGIVRASGDGDVRIRPARAGRRRVLYLALSAPGGQALFQAPLAVVERWLKRTHQVVPRGEESQLLDLDVELCELLGEAA
ncbi:SsgA family sporulation/cell division regulator [Streptomyces sp. NK08204]|uniref:SsgA family sporulation/cell division regulator n=1 Tax=Streptomyces sp. NK08204 TaxID=2873260 RepID=UPI001CEC4C32|nr:SsgA family sporulation/cell division regulator [Streptomyces sp. NK08204]